MLIQNLKVAIRTLRRTPGFTVPALLTLALGIGANTAMFSIVDALMLRPLPYRQPERLAMLWTRMDYIPSLKGRKMFVDTRLLDRWGELSRSFETTGGYRGWNATLSGAGEAERVHAVLVTGDLMKVLGIGAERGRVFTREDLKQGAPATALISHGYWMRKFGGDPAVLGRVVSLDSVPHTIVGVLPESAQLILPNVRRNPDVWAPVWLDFTIRTNKFAFCTAIGRLRPGVTVAQADAEIRALMGRIRAEGRRWSKLGTAVTDVRSEVATELRTPALVLFGAVGCVLLIATVNIANLLLARAAGREKEMGIRAVLGAGRGRLIRQTLLESTVVGLAGGALGLVLARWIVQGLYALWPGSTELLQGTTLSPNVLAFAAGIALLTGVLFGILPAWQGSRPDLSLAIKDAGASTRRGIFSPANILVVAETALAVMLLVGAGLLLRTFAALRAIDPGFQTEHVLVASLPMVDPRYQTSVQTVSFAGRLLDRLKQFPQIQAAGLTNSVPLAASFGYSATFQILGKPPLQEDQEHAIPVRIATPDYFRAIGLPVLRGRVFRDADVDSLIMNQAAAQRFFGREDPLGAQIEVVDCKPCTVVGVVADLKNRGLKEKPEPEFYVPISKANNAWLELAVRTTGDPGAAANAVRSALRSVDSNLAPDIVKTMTEVLSEGNAQPRFYAVLLSAFSGLATLLAAIGIFGVIAYSVTRRTKEFGIRMALGAGRAAVLRSVVAHGLVMAGIGVALGVGGALAATRVLRTMLWGVPEHDPVTFTAVAIAVLAVSAAAAWVPARRATRVDPMVALRYE